MLTFSGIMPANILPFTADLSIDEPAYAGLRDASQRFRDGVTRLFFDAHPKLPKLIRDFGVF